MSCESDALHWNIAQVENAGTIGQKAIESYTKLSARLNVPMHSIASANNRVAQLLKGKDDFMKLSRSLARKAQAREGQTIQPKESLTGEKVLLTIKNYLGGYYYFTADEAWIRGNDLYLAEGKHTANSILPSVGDIKDALIKMVLFCNLQNAIIGAKIYNPIAVVKLTSAKNISPQNLHAKERDLLETLKQEAHYNRFRIIFNNAFLT